MPSVSDRQRRFMGMKLAEQRRTGHNSTGMSEEQLRDYAKGRKHGKRSKKSRRRAKKRRATR